MKDDTIIVGAGRHPEDNYGIVNPPVYHASTILFPTMQAYQAEKPPGTVRYGRRGTPTSFALEQAVAELEGADHAVTMCSGLSAVYCALSAFVAGGDHVLMADNVYGPARNIANTILARFGVEITFFDPLIGAHIAGLIRDKTRAVYFESPGSHTFEMLDVPAVAAAARDRGVKVLMDNTWASPLFFKPFEHGVDLVVHAATKYIVGHSDAMLGVVTMRRADYDQLREHTQAMGVCAGPDDIYLGQRGLRTIGVRMRQHQVNAARMAEWLQSRPEVSRVLYPALPEDPGHEIWKRDFLGASGLFGVILKPCENSAVAAMLNGLELFGMGSSWGGYESLLVPSNPAKNRTATTWAPEGPSLRMHVGLEDVDDLIADLEKGFARLKAAA